MGKPLGFDGLTRYKLFSWTSVDTNKLKYHVYKIFSHSNPLPLSLSWWSHSLSLSKLFQGNMFLISKVNYLNIIIFQRENYCLLVWILLYPSFYLSNSLSYIWSVVYLYVCISRSFLYVSITYVCLMFILWTNLKKKKS